MEKINIGNKTDVVMVNDFYDEYGTISQELRPPVLLHSYVPIGLPAFSWNEGLNLSLYCCCRLSDCPGDATNCINNVHLLLLQLYSDISVLICENF